MIRSCLRAAPAALFVMLALAGCGPEDRPLARVVDRTITVRDFARAASAGGANLMMLPPDEARRGLLELLVRRQLEVAAAHARGVDTTAAFRNFRRSILEQSLLSALSSQISPPDVGASEAETRRMHEWRATASDVQLIYAPDSSLLGRCRAELAAGVPWAQVADQFGGMSGLPQGGSLGTRPPGSLPQPLDEALRTLPVGTVGGPYHAPQGWFLMRVTRRSPAPEPPFDTQRSALQQLVRQRKWTSALMTGVAALEPEYHVAFSPEAASVMALLLSPARVGGQVLPPDAAQRGQVIATWDGGSFLLGDAWSDLERPDVNKPAAAFVPSIRDWLRERVLTRVALQEARRRHLDEEPAVVDHVRDQADEYLVKSVEAAATAGLLPPDEATLRAAWDPIRDRYPQLQQARVAWVTFPDSARAWAVAAGGAGPLADAVRAAAPEARVQVTTVKFPSTAPEWSMAQESIERLAPGQWAPPVRTREGWRVMQLVDKVQGPLDWEHLGGDMKQLVAGNVEQGQRQSRLAAYADSLRRALNPVVLADGLRHVAWPPEIGGAP